MTGLWIDRDGDLWCFGAGGSWILTGSRWCRMLAERETVERGTGPLTEFPAPPDGAE